MREQILKENEMTPMDRLRQKLSPKNPAAPLNWRDRLGKALAREDVPCSFHDDTATRKIRKHYRDQITSRTEYGRASSIGNEAIATAIRIDRGNLEYLKPIVRALLLTELDNASIANEVGLSEEAIQWYRVAFFDVDRYLKLPLLVVHKVIGVFDGDGKLVLNAHKLWMLVGYFLKSVALKKLLSMSPPSPDANTEWTDWLASQMLASLKFKQFIAVNGLKADDPKQNAVLLKLIGQEAGARERDEKDEFSPSLRQVGTLLDLIPWSVGDDAEKVIGGTPLYKFDEGAAELRDDEVWKVATNQPLDAADGIQLLKLPPPSRQKPTPAELHQRGRPQPPTNNQNLKPPASSPQVPPHVASKKSPGQK
jgi:hypothetical protein